MEKKEPDLHVYMKSITKFPADWQDFITPFIQQLSPALGFILNPASLHHRMHEYKVEEACVHLVNMIH